MKKCLLLLLTIFLLLFWTGCLSRPSEEDLIYEDLSIVLPETQRYQVEIINKKGQVLYSYEKQVNVDEKSGEIAIKDRGANYEYEGCLNKDFILLNSQLIYKNEADIKNLGYDKRVTVFYPEEREIVLQVLTEGQVLYSKDIKLENNTYDLESFGFFVQALQLKGFNRFRGKVINMSNGQQIKVEMKQLSEESLQKLLAKKQLPEQIRNLDPNVHYYYEMGVRDWNRIFFPYKFYLIFEREAPFYVTAFWGEHPRYTTFQLFKINEE